MTQATLHLSMAPKSNTVIDTFTKARQAVRSRGSLPVPLHLRNAPTSLLRSLGHGKGYQYPHDFPEHVISAHYLPDALREAKFYTPRNQGREKEHVERLATLEALRKPSPR